MRTNRWLAAVAAMALAGLAACSGGGTSTVTLLEYTASVPSGWESRTPSNDMRLAEYTVRSGGDSADVVVYYFGEGQGGSVEQNIERWSSQFTAPEGEAVTPTVSNLNGTAFTTTLVELQGSYGRGMGMGPGRETATAGQALDAAVVETPRGNFFIQLFGAAATVEAARAAFLEFVKSIQ
jgi:hypothetical protein